MRVLTAEQMTHVDRATIEGGVPGIELMRNAGTAVYESMADEFSPLHERDVVVIAGKGNNGGDGFRIAELLVKNGVRCTAFLIGKRAEVAGDALTCLRDAERAGCVVAEVSEGGVLEANAEKIFAADVIVDALFGTGLKGELAGIGAVVVHLVNRSRAQVVAVDIPSGVNATTGQTAQHAVQADYTVTFGCLKAGHVMNPGRRKCGAVRVVDIGFSQKVLDSVTPFAHSLTLGEAADLLPERPFDAHKNSAGRVFFVSGSVGMTGAATLSSLAAMRAGAGVARIGCPESLNDILEVKLTEVMTTPLPEVRKKRCLSLRSLGRIRELAETADIVAVGPGLGTYFETTDLVRRFIAGYTGKVVLDADGINAFSGFRELLANAPCDMVLTPHAGELSRIMGIPAPEITEDPIAAAENAAISLRKIVLLKGPDTVIADPSGAVWVNATGSEILATAGSGDVLTGIISGLAAQGLGLFNAAVLGACVHGICGDITAQIFHNRGALSGDFLEFLPEAFHHIVTAG